MSAGYRLSEAESRRPEWAGGTALLLPDGQAWWFCEPAARAVAAGGKTAVALVFGAGLDGVTMVSLSDAAYRVLGKYGRAETGEQRASCVLEWGMLCWGRNYDLSPSAFEAVMTAGAIGEGLLRRMEGMLLRAVGEARRVLAGTSEGEGA